jgi:protocatechuate 3,4-dioxygenase alpha subunit
MDLTPTPSQTIGPFFHLALTTDETLGRLVSGGATGDPIELRVRVIDGDGVPLGDAMIELWQADANGKFNHPADAQESLGDPGFRGFGRLATNDQGSCSFETVKPGRVAGSEGERQAPHINVSVFARGLLTRLFTRIYFEGDAANEQDSILALVPEGRRGTLMAREDSKNRGIWSFEIRLCCEDETVFFDI